MVNTIAAPAASSNPVRSLATPAAPLGSGAALRGRRRVPAGGLQHRRLGGQAPAPFRHRRVRDLRDPPRGPRGRRRARRPAPAGAVPALGIGGQLAPGAPAVLRRVRRGADVELRGRGVRARAGRRRGRPPRRHAHGPAHDDRRVPDRRPDHPRRRRGCSRSFDPPDTVLDPRDAKRPVTRNTGRLEEQGDGFAADRPPRWEPGAPARRDQACVPDTCVPETALPIEIRRLPIVQRVRVTRLARSDASRGPGWRAARWMSRTGRGCGRRRAD